MEYDDDFKRIINERNFKQFFECYYYLLITGLRQRDAFKMTLKHFPENKIWENIAFIRFEVRTLINDNKLPQHKYYMIIGLLNDKTINLSNMFDVYRKSICEGSLFFVNNNLEDLVEIKEFHKPKDDIFNVLKETFKKHFGYNIISE